MRPCGFSDNPNHHFSFTYTSFVPKQHFQGLVGGRLQGLSVAMEQQQVTQTNADNQVVRRRLSRRLAGLEADPPMEMKKARARRGARSKPNQGEAISSAGSNDQSVEVGERGFPIPKAELFEFPGFGYAYAILTDAIPLPVDLYAPTEPPAQSSDGTAPAPPSQQG